MVIISDAFVYVNSNCECLVSKRVTRFSKFLREYASLTLE